MPPRNTPPSSAVLKRSHEIREQKTEQQKSSLLNEAACLRRKNKSSELCSHSNELLSKSRVFRESLRKLRHAS